MNGNWQTKNFKRASKSDLGNCKARKRSNKGDKVSEDLVILYDSGKMIEEILINDP